MFKSIFVHFFVKRQSVAFRLAQRSESRCTVYKTTTTSASEKVFPQVFVCNQVSYKVFCAIVGENCSARLRPVISE